jgi:hypothetical protein
MAQTKHQKLAREVKLLAQKFRKKNISLQFELPDNHSNSNQYVTDNILLRLQPLKTMVKAYHYAFLFFNPAPKDFEILRLMQRGAFIEIAGRHDKSSDKPIKRFVIWNALINYLEKDSRRSINDLQIDFWDLPFEANAIKILKKESLQNSLSYQTLNIARYERQKPSLKAEYAKQKKQMDQNLLKKALPIWEDSKRIFQAGPSENSDPDADIEVASNPSNLDSVSFAPNKKTSIKTAYNKIINSIQNREDRHRFALRKIYKKELEKSIFKDISEHEMFKKLPLIPIKNLFFKITPKNKTAKQGRWESSQVVDYQTMNSIFNHFYSTFILDPKNTKAGDIAFFILLRILATTLGKSEDISTEDILNITSLDVNFPEKTLKIGNEILPIPHWIFLLLRCYVSNKKQNHAHRLFKSLDIHGKALERAFREASKAVLGSDVTPILPEAMKYLPHGYIEGRIPISELKTMRQVEPLITP